MRPDTDLQPLWDDQREFNELLRTLPVTDEEREALTSKFVLHLFSECHELLRCVKWKIHRRENGATNRAHIREELIDILKMWMTVAQVWEPDLASLIPSYWEKSAVVRQRHAEEWLRDSQRPCAVLDLDNVLANFSVGMACWLYDRQLISHQKRRELIERRLWIDGPAVGVADADTWAGIKHEFYVTGGFRTLPLTAGARELTDWIRGRELNMVILTSRPIEQYPNILTDTVFWLQTYGIQADFIWWGRDKDKKLRAQNVLRHVQFVVDDDTHYIDQFVTAGVRDVFWYDPGAEIRPVPHGCIRVPALMDVARHYKGD